MRDQLLAAVRARIDAATGTGDPAELLAEQAVAEADQLLGFLALPTDVDVAVMHTVGVFHWLRASVQFEDAESPDQVLAATLLTPLYFNRPEALPEPVRSAMTEAYTEIGSDGGEDDPAHHFAGALSDLGMLLLERLVLRQERHSGQAATGLFRNAANLLPAGHPVRAVVLCNLGYALMLDDLGEDGLSEDVVDEAVGVLREAFAGTPTDHPNYSRCANGLALAVRGKAALTTDVPLLVEAIKLFRTAVRRATSIDLNLPQILADLALSLLVWAHNAPDADPDAVGAAIGEAIAALERSLQQTPPDTPDWTPRWSLLVRAQMARATSEAQARHERRRSPSTSMLDDALAGLGTSDASKDNPLYAVLRLLNFDETGGQSRDSRLAEFGMTLLRFPTEIGMAEVVGKAQETLLGQFDHLDPAERPEALRRFLESDDPPPAEPVDPSSLDELIELHERLLATLPDDHPDRLGIRLGHHLMALAQALALASARATTPDQLAARMDGVRESMQEDWRELNITSDRIESVFIRSSAMRSPFAALSRVDREVKRYRRQLAELPDDDPDRDPDRAIIRTDLANALFRRLGITSEEEVFQEAVRLARQVIAAGWPPPKPQLVVSWGMAAAIRMRRETIGGSDAVGAGVRGSGTAVLVANSAADMLAYGDGPGALEALEDGRATMLSAALRARRELGNLRAADRELADRFSTVREEIYAGMDLGMALRPGAHERYTALDAELGELIERIKAVPGFARFLLPVSLSLADLLPAAVEGPVVTINVSPRRCDALALLADQVRVIPLPDLRADELTDRADAFHAAIGVLSSGRARLAIGPAQESIRETLGWLWDVLAEPVLTGLGFTDCPADDRPADDRSADGQPWPRLWWSPTGPLNFLPLHAAGHPDRMGAAVLDRVVSSYTPTVRALMHSRWHPPAARRTALAVAMPFTEGQAALPATTDEITAFTGQFTGRVPLVGPTATRAAVLAALPDAAIAHFACHASSDPADASASRLLLHDGPLDVTDISQLELGHAELAYLSACATARGGIGLAEEAIHIASAFQLAGYAQVIGTLWEIGDRVAARVAAEFHRELAATVHDPVRPAGAHALHAVIRRLRAELPAQPWVWAAYLHAGA